MDKLKISAKIGYGAADLGGCLINMIITSYYMYYCTNVINIPLVIVGMIIFVSKIWDGINDIIVGGMVDRTFTEKGQARPWIAKFTIPFAVISCFMFAIPAGATVTVKVIWAVIAYSIFTWCYTAINLPYSSLMTLMTNDSVERTTLNTVRMVCALIGNIIVMACFLPLVEILTKKTGNKPVSYLITVIIYAFVAACLWFITYFVCHEKKVYTPEEIAEKKAQIKSDNKNYSVLQHARYLFTQNLPWLCSLGISLCFFTRQAVDSNSVVYYFVYVLRLPEASSSMYSTASYICMVVFLPISAIILAKIGNKRMMAISNIAVVICLVLGFLFSNNLTMSYIFHSLSFGLVVVCTISILNMLADSIDYGEVNYGLRLDGLGMTAYSFASKVGPAIGSLLCTLIFAVSQLDTSIEAGGIQKASALIGINITLWIIPATLHSIVAILSIIYPLTEKKRNEIMNTLIEKRKTDNAE